MNSYESFQNNAGSRSEQIIQQLELKAGKKLKIVKRVTSYESRLEVGKELEGILKNDVKIGMPIEFDNDSNTSNVRNIREENGKYLIQTLTSTYEIINSPLEKENKNITDFESFETERGSVYKVLENGQVQRFKTALDDPSYIGDDKGEKKERESSDVIIFYDSKKSGSWLNDFSATDSRSGKSVAQCIDIGVYKKINERTYQLVRNSKSLDSSFIFVRVRKDDSFKLKEVFDFEELKNFQERTLKSENKGLGTLIQSDEGNITNIPRVGFNTVDYKYGYGGKISSMHCGNKVVSIKEK